MLVILSLTQATCFFDYSWSYLTSPEQKLFMKVAIPSAIVIATPECVGTLSTGILKIESLQAILSIARHQLDTIHKIFLP